MPAVPRRAPRSNTSQLQYLTRHAVVPIHACAHRARCVSPLDQHATSRAPPPYANQRSAPYRVDLARSHTFDSRRGGVLLVDQRLLALSRIGGGARRRAVTVVVARRERGGRAAAAGVDAVETRLHVVLDLAREAALVAQRTLRVRALGGAAALLALGRAVADDGRGRHGHFYRRPAAEGGSGTAGRRRGRRGGRGGRARDRFTLVRSSVAHAHSQRRWWAAEERVRVAIRVQQGRGRERVAWWRGERGDGTEPRASESFRRRAAAAAAGCWAYRASTVEQ